MQVKSEAAAPATPAGALHMLIMRCFHTIVMAPVLMILFQRRRYMAQRSIIECTTRVAALLYCVLMYAVSDPVFVHEMARAVYSRAIMVRCAARHALGVEGLGLLYTRGSNARLRCSDTTRSYRALVPQVLVWNQLMVPVMGACSPLRLHAISIAARSLQDAVMYRNLLTAAYSPLQLSLAWVLCVGTSTLVVAWTDARARRSFRLAHAQRRHQQHLEQLLLQQQQHQREWLLQQQQQQKGAAGALHGGFGGACCSTVV